MLPRDVGRLAGVRLQVEEAPADRPVVVVRAGLPARAGRAGEAAVRVREVELPAARPQRLELAAPVEIERLVRRLRARLAGQERPDVAAVDDPPGGQLGAG